MKSRFVSLRAKLALLIAVLTLSVTGAAIFAVIGFGEGALVRIGDAQSRLVEGALLDEWEKTAVADSKLVARSLVDSVAALDASAILRIAGLTRNEPGVAYIYVLTPEGQVLADGTNSLQSVGKVLSDELTRSAVAANDAMVRKNGELVDVAVPIRLGQKRLGAVRIGHAPEHILGVVAVLKRQVRAAIDRAGDATLLSLVGMMAAIGVLVLVAGLLFARSMAAPLPALVEATRSFGAGHLSTRVRLPPRNDELGELAASFDDMMDDIEGHAAGLERLVDQRTHDLRESELRLRSIIDNAKAEIVLKDLEGRYLMVNRTFESNHGVTQAEIAGKTLSEIYSPEQAAHFEDLDRKVARTGEAVQEELIPVENPNAELYLSTKFPVRNAVGKLVAIGSINTDISDIKHTQDVLRQTRDELAASVDERTRELGETEERYRQLVNVSPDGIMVHSDGLIVFANPTYVALIGADSVDQVMGRAAIDFVPEDDRATVMERRRNAVQSEMLGHRETSYKRLDGELIPVERAIARITWQGKPAFLILARDITERKRSEEQLRQSQKMEAVGQLTGGIAHDFNNLLTVILGYFELKEGGASSPDAVERMGGMANLAARRGADLTQRLLAFARRQPLRPTTVDLSELVDGMTDLISRTLGATITIHTESDGKMWPCVVDAAQLENSLLNLCLNARDAMPGGGELVVKTRNVELDEPSARRIGDLTAGKYVRLSVIDDGHGMTREIAAKVLEPFFTTKTAERGTGLGLSMVYGFVRQSGGDVRIVTALDAGTTVELYLPASQESVVDIPVKSTAPATARGNGEKVLVVEDDPAVREYGATLLLSLGYDVIEAPDGPSALEILQKDDTVELLFSDVVMPGGMHGPELARRGRELRPDLKVVLTSGYPQDDQNSIDLGSDELLPKPYTSAQLSTIIRRVLDGAGSS